MHARRITEYEKKFVLLCIKSGRPIAEKLRSSLQVPEPVMEPSSSVMTALKGRTQVRFQPSPPDTNVMALSSSPSSTSSFAMTSTWQQRLPSWSTPVVAGGAKEEEEEEREEERAFRPPERTESQKYDAWKDIFQRAEHYQNNFRKVPGK